MLLLLARLGGGAGVLAEGQGPCRSRRPRRPKTAARRPSAKAAPKRDPKAVPVFVPLDTFTVNLADREAERYAQIGISLELDDAKAGEKIKVFMPAIRNNILMVLAHKRSSDLLERAGKEKLAEEVLRETERALGLEPAAPGAAARQGRRRGRAAAGAARCTSPTSSSSDARHLQQPCRHRP